MKKIATFAAACAALTALSTGVFAQGANMNAPQPNSTGTGVTQPGTTSTGVAVDRPKASGQTGGSVGTTTGATDGNTANSARGTNSATNPKNMGNGK